MPEQIRIATAPEPSRRQDPSEFLAIDTWNDIEGLQKFMRDPRVAAAFGELFEGMPDVSVGAKSDWASF